MPGMGAFSGAPGYASKQHTALSPRSLPPPVGPSRSHLEEKAHNLTTCQGLNASAK